MSYTIATLKDDMSRKLHGSTLNKLKDPNGLINEAIRQVLQDIDPAETKRTQQVTNAIYDQVFSYQLPTDLKANKIIDIYPQVNRDQSDSARQTYTQFFEKTKLQDSFYIRNDSGVKSLRYSKSVIAGQLLSAMNDTDGWSTGNDAENLTKDTLNYISSGASLKFDIDGSTTDGFLEKSDLDALDLSDREEEGAYFLWVFFPDVSIITSINLRWGNDSSNFWDRTVTTPQDGTALQTGWNLLRFDWNGANSTGTPDSSDIDYTRITVNYNGTGDTNLRADSLIYRFGSIFNIDYYSKFLLRTSAGVFHETVTDDNDMINLDTDSYNVLLYKVSELMAQEVQGEDSSFDVQIDTRRYQQARKQYSMLNKSEILKPQQSYYRVKTKDNFTNIS